jgi:acyl-ACP thioesterase
MEPVSVYRKKYVIGINEVDFTQKLKQSALFGYFQDIASHAVLNLNIGINELIERFHVTWVLVRIRADIVRNPGWNEEITLETWPQEPGRLEFERDFLVTDGQGNVIIRAVSTWVIMDVDTREVKKSELIHFKYPSFKKERAMDCRLGRLKPSGTPEAAYKRIIGYSDVDMNGHLNNSKYVDFIMDCFTVENHRQYEVRSIEVNYLSEALPGETLVLRRELSEINANHIYIDGVNEAGDKTVFRARLEIGPRITP